MIQLPVMSEQSLLGCLMIIFLIKLPEERLVSIYMDANG